MALLSDHVGESVLHNFAKRLANNEPKLRKIALRKLQRWIETRSDGFGENEFLKIWKGLHYCMWMTDKPLIQEELADRITQMVHCFKNYDTMLHFVGTFFMTEAREWSGTDQLRMDKFMSLVRKMLRQSLKAIQNRGWADNDIVRLVDMFYSTVLDCANERIPDGMRFHIDDIYVDELTGVGSNQLNPQQVLKFVEPFCHLIAKSSNKLLVNHTVKTVFNPLLKQTNVTEGGGEAEGVETNCLQIDRQQLAERLMKLASKRSCKNRSSLYRLIKRCREMASDVKTRVSQSAAAPDADDLSVEMNDDNTGIRLFESNGESSVLAVTAVESQGEKSSKKQKKKNMKRKNEATVVAAASVLGNGWLEAGVITASPPAAANVNEALELERSVAMAVAAVGKKRKLDDEDDDDGDMKRGTTVPPPPGSLKNLKEDNDSGEVEIWIPNKKYKKAKMMGVEKEEQKIVEEGGSAKKAKKSSSPKVVDRPFLMFVGGDTTPAALIRRRRQKQTPSSEPKQQQQRHRMSLPNSLERPSTDQQKRVKFAMNLNKSQNFEESLNVTPKPPFDPQLQPDRTILKPSPVSTMVSLPIAKTAKQKLFGVVQRARASDFF